MSSPIRLLCVLAVAVSGLSAADAPAKPKPPARIQVSPDFAALQEAEFVFAGTLTAVKELPVRIGGRHKLFSTDLSLEVKEAFRGGIETGAKLTLRHEVPGGSDTDSPVYPAGALCFVAAQTSAQSRGWAATFVKASTPELQKDGELVRTLPLGWRSERGALASPWAGLGAAAWPKDVAPPAGAPVCSVTGRPALLTGKGIRLAIEPIKPPNFSKWTNPDGDGEFRVIVTNAGAEAREVPALLSDGQEILWNESLVVECDGKVYAAPKAKPLAAAPKPAKLGPGESVMGYVHTMALKDVRWPQGSGRVAIAVCLGELRARFTFQYTALHHDKIRAALARE